MWTHLFVVFYKKKDTLISGVDKFEAAESVVVVGADVGLGVVVGSGPATI